ncbi:MAG: hypothetical protein GYA73_09720, partial [Planctomycetes bacterium]|nr:hypothetical protein [Planctomycetota bacterium]
MASLSQGRIGEGGKDAGGAVTAPARDDLQRRAQVREAWIGRDLVRAGGRLDMKGKIGADIMGASRVSNVPWEKLAEGERHLVSLGGGEFLDKIAPVRQR